MPDFAPQNLDKRVSKSKHIDRKVRFDPATDLEYERCSHAGKRQLGYWHEIDAKQGVYRHRDSGGNLVEEMEGEWKRLR